MAKEITFSPTAIDALDRGALARARRPGLTVDVLSSGKKRWRFRRNVVGVKSGGKQVTATLFGGPFPAVPIAAAREWASALNELVEAGVDPRAQKREENARNAMTVAKAHQLYMAAVRDGRSTLLPERAADLIMDGDIGRGFLSQ